MLKVPEQAIQCFEELTETRVSCYVHTPIFTQALKYRIHNNRTCSEVKQNFGAMCTSFDCLGFCRDAWKIPEGCVKLCHAGILEWVFPVMRDGKLLCLLTAGIRRPPEKGIPPELLPITAQERVHPPDLSPVRRASQEELFRTLEALRQLGARLLLWYEKMIRDDFPLSDLSREDRIRLLINREASKQMTLKKLAGEIHLSPSRTAHLVRETTGESFSDLLMRNRLEYAADLLKNTIRPVSAIAFDCGFGSAANFHRMFRKYYGITPLACRRSLSRPLFRKAGRPAPSGEKGVRTPPDS